MSFTQRRVWSLCFWGFTHFRKFFAYRNNGRDYRDEAEGKKRNE
jgi:hypothetical protein